MCSSERNGQITSGIGPLDRRVAHVAEAEIDERSDPGELGLLGSDVEHPLRGVDADHRHARRCDRDRDPARADTELDDRPARCQRLLHVEADVLDHAPRPRVVEAGDGVVYGHLLDSVAAVDWTAYEEEATAAIAAATSETELDDVRVRVLGRKSELAQALRGVRDREAGILLNGIRGRLEAAVDGRERHASARGARPAPTRGGVDVTLPGEQLPLGHLHPITQVRRMVEDAFLGLGFEVRDDREVETVEYNFDKLAFAPTHSSRSPRDTFFFDDTHVLRTETIAEPDPHPRGEAAADLHGVDRPRVPP